MRTASLVTIVALLLVGSPRAAFAVWPHDPAVNLALSPTPSSDNPAVLADGAGGAFIAWPDSRGTGFYDIYVQHVLASGIADPAWPVGGRAVCTSPENQSAVRMIADGSGGVLLAWEDWRSGFDADVYAHHVLASGALDPAWPADGRAVCTFAADQTFIALVSDGAGGAIATWQDGRPGSTTDIFAQHVLASGVVDGAWPANGRNVCTAGFDQSYPTIVSDGAGGAIIGWQDSRAGIGNGDIYAQHILAAGTPDGAWPANGRALCTATGEQAFARVVTDGSGGAIVAWTDQRGGVYRVYAQHVSSGGVVDAAWPANGRALTGTPATQWELSAVSDGGTGALVAWSDGRAGNFDVYIQHVLIGGIVDPAWPADGRAVCTAAGTQSSPQLVSDGAAGALLAWTDSRGGAFTDIYASRVLASGALDPSYPANGRAVCTAASVQNAPAIALDPPAAAIVAWMDYRSGGFRIYAQRVDRWGYLGGVEPEIVSVRDVPNDQGGKVKLSWNGSYLDPLFDANVASYDILRSVPASLAGTWLANGTRSLRREDDEAGLVPGDLVADPAGTSDYYWEFLTSTPALHYVSNYSYAAATLSDSVAGSNPKTVFMVVARNSTTTTYWLSAPDSGYSVDNLVPAAPSALSGDYGAGSTQLHWAPNAEPDLAHYRVYRGPDASFVPGPANLIASPPDTGYTDVVVGAYVYKLTAVDTHGNESPAATLTPEGTVDVGEPRGPVLSFADPSPNPARARVAFRFTLAAEGPARLALYDAAGRLVRELVNEGRPAGAHDAAWDMRDAGGRAVPPGLYFARLDAGGERFARRVAVTQ